MSRYSNPRPYGVLQHGKPLGKLFKIPVETSASTSLPTPTFRVLSDGSIVPTIGTAGTFTRSGAFLYPTSLNTLASAGANAAPAPAFVTGQNAPAATLGGLWAPWALINYCTEASTFNNWTAIGTGTVTTNSTTDPLGGSTADTLIGAAAGDGRTLDSGITAASKTVGFSVWLKCSSGTRSVTIKAVDSGGAVGTLGAVTATVTTSWKQFKVLEKFAGGSGNAFMSVVVNDTTGYSIFGYGAGFYWIDPSTPLCPSESFFPTIITTGATVTTGSSLLAYEGAELTASWTKATFVNWFYYSDAETINLGKFNSSTIFHAHKSPPGYETLCWAHYDSTNGKLVVALPDGTAVTTSYVFGSDSNKWHQLVCALDGAGNTVIYVDAISVATSSATWASTSFTKYVLGTKFFDGSVGNDWYDLLGQGEIYIGTTASASNVATLYSSQKASYGL